MRMRRRMSRLWSAATFRDARDPIHRQASRVTCHRKAWSPLHRPIPWHHLASVALEHHCRSPALTAPRTRGACVSISRSRVITSLTRPTNPPIYAHLAERPPLVFILPSASHTHPSHAGLAPRRHHIHLGITLHQRTPAPPSTLHCDYTNE